MSSQADVSNKGQSFWVKFLGGWMLFGLRLDPGRQEVGKKDAGWLLVTRFVCLSFIFGAWLAAALPTTSTDESNSLLRIAIQGSGLIWLVGWINWRINRRNRESILLFFLAGLMAAGVLAPFGVLALAASIGWWFASGGAILLLLFSTIPLLAWVSGRQGQE